MDELPEEIRQQVDVMLVDTSNTYLSISLKLKDMGYEVSKSSIGRYASVPPAQPRDSWKPRHRQSSWSR